MSEDTLGRSNVLAKFLSSYQLDIQTDIAHESMRLQMTVSNLITEEKWDKVAQLTAQMRSKAVLVISQLKAETMICTQRIDILHEIYMEENKLHTKLVEELKDSAHRAQVEEVLLQREKSPELIGRFLTSSSDDYRDKFATFQQFFFGIISERLQYAIAIGYSGFWGGFHTAFNQYIRNFIPRRLSQVEIDEIEKMVKVEQKAILSDLLKIYSVLVQGSKEATLHTCLDILRSQEERLKWLALLCAALCASTQAALKGKLNKDAKTLGPVDLQAGQTARLWILLCTVSLYAARLAILPEDNSEVKQAIKAAHKLPFESSVPDRKNVSMRDLLLKGSEYDNKYVEITGFVRGLKTRRTTDGKLLTIFNLYELDSEETIEVIAIYEHMGHRGLINSSYVRVNGQWKESSNITDHPALQLDRLNLSELKEKSWFEHILVAVRPWFDFYPNSHHVFWSLRPERKGARGLSSVLTGSGELVFISPFIVEKEES